MASSPLTSPRSPATPETVQGVEIEDLTSSPTQEIKEQPEAESSTMTSRTHSSAFPNENNDEHDNKRAMGPGGLPKKAPKKKTKRQRIQPLDTVAARPWCFYCERDFQDLMVLTNHQKAKHFRCHSCNRRLNTAGGLRVHLDQVHKEGLSQIENALPGREDPSIEIFGMEGIPAEVAHEHRTRVISEWQRRVEEFTRETGNGPPGTKPNPPKRIREDPEKLLERLAIFKRKKAEEKAHQEALRQAGEAATQQEAEKTAVATNEQINARANAEAAEQVAEQAGQPDEAGAAGDDGGKKSGKATVMVYSENIEAHPEELLLGAGKYAV